MFSCRNGIIAVGCAARMRVIASLKTSVAWQFFTQTAHPPVECGIPNEWIKSGDLRFSSNRCVEMGKDGAAYGERRDETTMLR